MEAYLRKYFGGEDEASRQRRLSDLANAQSAIEFLLDLDLLQGPNSRALGSVKAQMKSLHENLIFIRSFLKWMQESSRHPIRFRDFGSEIRNDAQDLLTAAKSCMFTVLDKRMPIASEIVENRQMQNRENILYYSLRIDYLVKKIKSAGFEDDWVSASARSNLSVESDHSQISVAETMVGFKDERLALPDRLMGNQKRLQIISITGMAGIGKTTLAQTLYNDQLVVYHFHVRGWASVSQVCQKSKLLSSILSCMPAQKDSLSSVSDQNIGEKLYKCLKGKRYLIAIDDIWDIGVWNDINMYFPNDQNRSRILITTRITDVASSASNSPPHCLRFLRPEESWHLFTQKAFGDKSCPHELMNIGKKIVAKCEGLPLAIVVIAGLLLKKEKTNETWSHVAENIGSLIDSNEEQIMDILALSYEHLPQHLKLCFLYLGTFPEDYEIPVKKLLRSWIARQYIKETGGKRLEDLAEDYLMELINRSLVIVAKRRSIGGTKTCRIHDMVRKLCIRRSEKGDLIMLPSSNNSEFEDVMCSYDLLRVLDLRKKIFAEFPTKILRLVRLKYLALQVTAINRLPGRLCLLRDLETFILVGRERRRRIIVPYEIWRMRKMRHMEISGELEFEHTLEISGERIFEFMMEISGGSIKRGRIWWWVSNIIFILLSPVHLLCRKYLVSPHPELHLQTISHLCASDSVTYTLAKTPNLRKVGFHFTYPSNTEQISFPDLASLQLLESVKFEYQTLGVRSIDLPRLDKFPPNLKKLTLIGSHVSWEQMSILGMLPNLEVLKVKDNFFSGPKWETSEDGFCSLRFLKLSHMNLQEWITSEFHFPKLEQLVLNACLDLVEIPSSIGDIDTLQVIKVCGSSSSAADSAWKIQEAQRDFGNDLLKVFIYPNMKGTF